MGLVRFTEDKRNHCVENRQEMFYRYYQWRLWAKDLDHTHYLQTIAKNIPADDWEKRAWMAMLFGMCYRVPQVHAYFQTFPDFHSIDWYSLSKWNDDNGERCTYGTDTRYNKYKFYLQAKSIKDDWLKGRSFKEAICKVVKKEQTPEQNFWKLLRRVQSVHKYGRMTAWLALQAMSDLLPINLQIKDIFIADPREDGSMKSIWNGLSFYRGRDDLFIDKEKPHIVTNSDVIAGRSILIEMKSKAETRVSNKICSFKHESILCQYKRLWLREGSREYPGHASGDATSRYKYYRKYWPEIDWSLMREAYRSQPGMIAGLTSSKELDSAFSRYGVLMNLEEMFPDMPNSWRTVGIDPNTLLVKEIWTDDGLIPPVKPY
jgi:hypothetical protein